MLLVPLHFGKKFDQRFVVAGARAQLKDEVASLPSGSCACTPAIDTASRQVVAP
ncbi:MAG: hypothetical protein JO057_00210 [Chloroflexi bacterium]|nr:hypothetical protein [Chloroflexota bacterium]